MSRENGTTSFEKKLYKAIEKSGPTTEIGQALQDNLKEAGITSGRITDCLVGSRLLNVASVAMDHLRRSPGKPLIETELAIKEPDDWLGKYVIRLLDESIRRPNHPRLPQFKSGRVRKLGGCAMAEDKFLTASAPDERKPSTLYINAKGHVVLFKKAVGQSSTLGIKTIEVNRIRYPAGVLFSMQVEEDIPSEVVSGFRIATISPVNIRGIAPLRFTQFAFRPQDRIRNFTPVGSFSRDEDYDYSTHIDQIHHLSDLVAQAPDKQTLMDVYDLLDLRTDDIE